MLNNSVNNPIWTYYYKENFYFFNPSTHDILEYKYSEDLWNYLTKKYSQKKEVLKDGKSFFLDSNLLNRYFDENIFRNFKIGERKNPSGYYCICNISDNCNLACKYCYRTRYLRNKNMDIDIANRIIDYLSKIDKKDIYGKRIVVVFFGGEPLLNFRILKYIVEKLNAAGLKRKIDYRISTNGILLNKEICSFFYDHKFIVQLSIDGDKKIQDLQRPLRYGKSSYDKIKKNLSFLSGLQKEGRASVRLTVSKNNLNFFESVKHVEDLGFKAIALGFVVGREDNGHLTNNDLEILEDNFKKTCEHFFLKAKNNDPIYIKNIISLLWYLCGQESEYSCGVTKNVFAVDYNGEMYPCQRFLGMNKYRIGSLLQNGLDKSKIENLRKCSSFNPFNKRCLKCWLRAFCGGHCFFLKERTGIMPCSLEHIMVDNILKFYVRLVNELPDFLSNTFYKSAKNNN